MSTLAKPKYKFAPVAYKIPLRVWLFGGDYERVNGGIGSRPSAARMIWRYFREGWWRRRPLRSWMDRHYYVARPDAPPKQPPKPKEWIDVAVLFFALALAALPVAAQPCRVEWGAAAYASGVRCTVALDTEDINRKLRGAFDPTATKRTPAELGALGAPALRELIAAEGVADRWPIPAPPPPEQAAAEPVAPLMTAAFVAEELRFHRERWGFETVALKGNRVGEGAPDAAALAGLVAGRGQPMCAGWAPSELDLQDARFVAFCGSDTPWVHRDSSRPAVTECPRGWTQGPLIDTSDPACTLDTTRGLPAGLCCGVDSPGFFGTSRTCWYSPGCVVSGQPPVEPGPEPTDPEPEPDPGTDPPIPPAACDLAPVLDAIARLELQVAELLSRPACPTALEVEAAVADDFRDVGGAIVTITPARVVEAVRGLCGETP